MKTYLDCWTSTAKALFAQTLSGEPQLQKYDVDINETSDLVFVAELSGDLAGRFTVVLDARILDAPLHGDGVDQQVAWREFLREVTETAAGELLASSGLHCRVTSFEAAPASGKMTHAFQLSSGAKSWFMQVRDELRPGNPQESVGQADTQQERVAPAEQGGLTRGVELLLDVELEAALRFGCRELPLGEILELRPGDVVELDRHISDPVDLIVGDKIVARGDVVLVNGNFGLRISEVAEPQRRLESIRCLF